MKNVCENITFGDLRNQILDDLEKSGIDKNSIMLLRCFSNNLLDNTKMLHIHTLDSEKHYEKFYTSLQSDDDIILLQDVQQDKTTEKVWKLDFLYAKCKSLDMPRGYINLYPAETINKILESSTDIISLIYKYVENSKEFKTILHTFNTNYSRAENIIKLRSVMENKDVNFSYLMKLPVSVLKAALKTAKFHEKCCSMTMERVMNLEKLYYKNSTIFDNAKHYPSFLRLALNHTKVNLMDDFVDLLWHNEKQIRHIRDITDKLSLLIQSYEGIDENDEAKALIDLAKYDLNACEKLLNNNRAIHNMQLEMKLVCKIVREKKEIFDILFSSNDNLLEIVEKICDEHNISPNDFIRDLIESESIEGLKRFMNY